MRNLTDDKKKEFTWFWGINQPLDKAILGDFHQYFSLTWLIWACQSKSDVPLNWRRLPSAIFRRACFDIKIRITARKIIFSQFFWNQKWFQVWR